MGNSKWARLGTVCVCAALCGAGHAAGARASVTLRPVLAGRARVRIWSSANPAVNAITTTIPATAQLATFERPIHTGRVTYWMGLNVFTDDQGGSPQLEVFLVRGHPGHFQFHQYSWLRTPSFRFNRRSMTARLDGGAISPSAMTMTFRPTRITTHTCTLAGGGSGTYRKAVGRLTVSRFRIATNTSPVFGTITVRPQRAELLLDPGCRSDLVGSNPHPCPPAELINAPGLARSEWGADTNPAGTKALIDAVSPSTTLTKMQHVHVSEETLPITDLPSPTVAANGATATFLTTGSLFARGVGVFTSTRAPTMATGSCTLRGVAHTYSTTFYRGTLSPGVPPLVALFDTGRIGLVPGTPAGLWVSRLTS